MITTIDKAGRVVIPAALRERLGLEPGTEIEITVDDLALRLQRSAPGPVVERVGGRLVVRPTVPAQAIPKVDVAGLIEEERDRWPV